MTAAGEAAVPGISEWVLALERAYQILIASGGSCELPGLLSALADSLFGFYELESYFSLKQPEVSDAHALGCR